MKKIALTKLPKSNKIIDNIYYSYYTFNNSHVHNKNYKVVKR